MHPRVRARQLYLPRPATCNTVTAGEKAHKRKYLQPIGRPFSQRSIPTKVTRRTVDNPQINDLAKSQAVCQIGCCAQLRQL
jgi:hypothetical protein